MYFKRFSKHKCDLHCSDTCSYYSFPWSNAQENGFAWFIWNLCHFCLLCLYLHRWQFCIASQFCSLQKPYFPSEIPKQTLRPLCHRYLQFIHNSSYILSIGSKKKKTKTPPYSSQELSRPFPLEELCFDRIFQFLLW